MRAVFDLAPLGHCAAAPNRYTGVMLSYQHIYHAGNLADVHKHALLAWMLDYLTRKDKPLTYLETHAGRALYDLSDNAAVKTGEAAQGIQKTGHWFGADHPYRKVLDQVSAGHGDNAYPGSPMIAANLLRPQDRIHLAELHPQEHSALDLAMSPYPVKCYLQDGFDMAFALSPPTPRRGMLLIDPSFEIKTDYTDIPRHIGKLARAWSVGIIALWYPILTSKAHLGMLNQLADAHPDALRHEVRFAPARPGHGMVGSGMFVLNPPYGMAEEAKRLAKKFAAL
ncbi:MAG: 23S rRNA (adenine2030-N6)-methyltransferase [Sulfitobacter sp.]